MEALKALEAAKKQESPETSKISKTPKPRVPRRPCAPPAPAPGGLEARQRGAAVLEVLGGLRTPVEAARGLGMSLPRFYALEKRALEGLLAACHAPGRKGRRTAPGREVERLRGQVERLEREASRNLAMARAAQRAAGMAPPPHKPPSQPSAENSGPKRRKKRRPAARALLAAQALRADPPPAGGAAEGAPDA